MDAATEQVWRERIAAFRASGLTAREFARRNGLHEATVSKYQRVFAAMAPPPAQVELTRVEPRSAAGREEPPGIEIVVSGLVVRVRRACDPELLRSVLGVLREPG